MILSYVLFIQSYSTPLSLKRIFRLNSLASCIIIFETDVADALERVFPMAELFPSSLDPCRGSGLGL